ADQLRRAPLLRIEAGEDAAWIHYAILGARSAGACDESVPVSERRLLAGLGSGGGRHVGGSRELATRPLHHRGELPDELHRVARPDETVELGQLLLEPRGVDLRPGYAEDLRVPRGPDGLVLRPELLVELLARAGADDIDPDVAARLEPGKLDHVAREV